MNDATGPLESDAAEQLRRDREQVAGIARRYPVPVAAAVVSGAALIWWTARRRQA